MLTFRVPVLQSLFEYESIDLVREPPHYIIAPSVPQQKQNVSPVHRCRPINHEGAHLVLVDALQAGHFAVVRESDGDRGTAAKTKKEY